MNQTQTTSENIQKARNDFPALNQEVYGQKLVYLDSAASALKPTSVIEAITTHYRQETANIHRGIHFLSEQGTVKYEASREAVRAFLGAASTQEIIFTKGTTESINLVATSWARAFLKKDDTILLSTLEHHSNIVPWQLAAAQVGARVVEIPITDEGEIDREAYEKLLAQGRPALVAMTHISNGLGTINPLGDLIKKAHRAGAVFLVDAAQSAPHLPLDVQVLDCDFLAFSSHKLYGPTGVGVLYGKAALLEKMPPYQGGGEMIERVSFEKTTYNELPHKFEAGTPPIAGVICLAYALEYLQKFAPEQLATHEGQLLKEAQKALEEIGGITFFGPRRNRAGILAFNVDGIHAHDVGVVLNRLGVAVRTGHHCNQPLMDRLKVTSTVRASFCLYNNREDIRLLGQAVKKAVELCS